MFKQIPLIAALLASSSLAFGQARPQVAFPPSYTGPSFTFGPKTADAANAAKFSFGAASNGAIFGNSKGYAPTPGGSSIPITVGGIVPPASAAGVIGKFAAKMFFPLQAGMALYDLAKDLGWNAQGGSSGVTFSQPPLVFDGYAYFASYKPSVLYGSQSSACGSFNKTTTSNTRDGPTTTTYSYTGGSTVDSCFVNVTSSPYPTGAEYSGRLDGLIERTTVATPVLEPKTNQQFIDAIAAKTDWPTTTAGSPAQPPQQPATGEPDSPTRPDNSGAPSSQPQAGHDGSAIGRAIGEAIRSGESLGVNPQSVTGPASSPGTQVVTNNGVTTVTSTTTNYYTYEGAKVTVTSTTVSNTINNSDGQPVGQPVTTSEQKPYLEPITPPKIEIDTCGLPGKPKCLIDESGTPAEVGSTFDKAKSDLDVSQTAAKAAIDSAAGIAAPTWSFTFQLPTGCAPYVTGIKGVVLNVCQYQSTMHSLLSAIWAAATAFAMIGMVGRTIREA